jgi:cell fate (sporulation/competence/biofilm development) regulator YlbF (YheA/YmcA/DUF963 family)
MEKIFELAKELGEALAAHPIGKKYHEAKEALDADEAAKNIIQEYEQMASKLGQKERQGKPIEPDEKRSLMALQGKISASNSVKKWMEAQVEYLNLLRQVNELVMKELPAEPAQ